MNSRRSVPPSTLGYLALAVFLVVFGVILQRDHGSNWAYLWAIGIALIVILIYSMFDVIRMRRVLALVPGATAVSISIYEQFRSQVEDIAKLPDVTIGSIPRRTSHCVVAVSPKGISVWRGSIAPTLFLDIPANRLGAPFIERTPQGMYQLASVRVPIVEPDFKLCLDFCVLDWRFLVPSVASASNRQDFANAIQRARASRT